jgi:hypothetical protein
MTRQRFSYLCLGWGRFAWLIAAGLNVIDASIIGKVIQKPFNVS